MSLEESVLALTAALQENTAAVHQANAAMGNVAPAPVPSVSSAPAATPATPAPAPAAVAPATPAAAVIPAAASPSEPAVTLDQLKQEVTAIYQRLGGDPRIMQVVGKYGNSLTEVQPAQYNALLAEVRGIG